MYLYKINTKSSRMQAEGKPYGEASESKTVLFAWE